MLVLMNIFPIIIFLFFGFSGDCVLTYVKGNTVDKDKYFRENLAEEGQNELCREIRELLTVDDEFEKKLQKFIVSRAEKCSLPTRYELKSHGLYYVEDVDGDYQDKRYTKVCSPLRVVAHVHDEHHRGWGLLVEFEDMAGHTRKWILKNKMLAGNGEVLRENMLDLGLRIPTPEAARLLQRMFLAIPETGPLYVNVTKQGWHGPVYVLGEDAFGVQEHQTADKYFFSTEGFEPGIWAKKGSLEEWQSNISLLCENNSRLVFSVSMSFASIFLEPLNLESGGFNLFGRSSSGKTTALALANSVFGAKERIQSWRSTANGVEAVTSLFNDSMFCLDELAQIEPKDAGAAAYMIGNNSGKMRANIEGEAKTRKNWRVLFLSSGEIPLSEHIESSGKQVRAGQLVRMIDVPAEPKNGFGVFEDVKGGMTPAQFANLLKNNSEKYCGSAVREYLKIITADRIANVEKIKIFMSEFVGDNVSLNCDGQVSRVADRFAIIGAAGELASEVGITGWSRGEAMKAASACFKAWIEYRGGIESQESTQILDQIRQFFQMYGSSRFEDWDNTGQKRVDNRAGYTRVENGKTCFYVFCECFKKEICSGLNRAYVLETLKNMGHLIFNQYPHYSTKSPEGSSAKYYKIVGILEESTILNNQFVDYVGISDFDF